MMPVLADAGYRVIAMDHLGWDVPTNRLTSMTTAILGTLIAGAIYSDTWIKRHQLIRAGLG
jgi:hypothetical protein